MARPKKVRNPGGKPKQDLTPKLHKLELCLIQGMRMTKALETADIPWSTYSNYCTENPEYPKKIDELKALLKQNAQEVAEKALERLIEANVDNPKMFQQVERLARWILEKRRREDYGEEKPQLPGGGNVNYGIQISLEKATTDQLRRITRGEDPKSVLEETQPVK